MQLENIKQICKVINDTCVYNLDIYNVLILKQSYKKKITEHHKLILFYLINLKIIGLTQDTLLFLVDCDYWKEFIKDKQIEKKIIDYFKELIPTISFLHIFFVFNKTYAEIDQNDIHYSEKEIHIFETKEEKFINEFDKLSRAEKF